MSSNLAQIALIISLAALAINGYLLWQFISLQRLKAIFFSGSSQNDLESVLKALTNDIAQSKQQNQTLQLQLKDIQNNFNFAVQKIGVVRFNPFADGGGNFSFSLAILDGHNNGVVLTSMHGREQNRIYAKNITAGNSDMQLTEEEQKAIKLASKP